MATESQVIKLMAEEIVRAIKKLTADNNTNYVESLLKNAKGLASSGSGGTSNTITGSVNASQVVGLYDAVANYIGNASTNAELNDPNAGLIVQSMAGIAALEVESAVIDTAQIENLYGSYAEFINLVAKNAEIEDLDVEQVRADIADMGLANIGSANIGWGQIKDLVTDTAIIREGIGGKLYIDRLAVTDAQILSLTTGELIIQGTDGKLYTVFVDEEGNVQTVLREVSGSDISSGSIEGSNIAENTITGALITENAITARELNVSKIFADEALIGAIKAANIDVGDLFANNAFVNTLETSIISSPTVGKGLDISGNSSIVMTDKKLGLVVSGESTETELVLSEQMINAITDRVNIMADDIDLSANESISLNVSNTVKKEIGYRMEIISTSDVLSNDIKQTTLNVKVYQGSDDITETLDVHKFNWYRISSDPLGDETWNQNHKGMVSISLTTLDVNYSATYQCNLEE